MDDNQFVNGEHGAKKTLAGVFVLWAWGLQCPPPTESWSRLLIELCASGRPGLAWAGKHLLGPRQLVTLGARLTCLMCGYRWPF
jgi:hypothetical protein